MKNIGKLALTGLRRRTPSLLLAMTAAAGLSQAAVTACATVTGTTIPATTSATDGCSSVDLNFVSFTSSVASTSVNYFATGGAITTSATPDTISTLNLNLASSSWTDVKDANASTYSISYQSTNNGTNAPQEATYGWVFSGLRLTPTLTLNGQDNAVVTYTFCFNATAATAGSGGCVAANQGTITATYTSGATTATSSLGSSFTTPLSVTNAFQGQILLTTNAVSNFTSVFINTAISLTATTGQAAAVGALQYGYDQLALSSVPEPSTAALLGTALIGLGYLRRRSR